MSHIPLEQTPVIIKTGGDGVPDGLKMPVIIQSDLMFFTEFVRDPTQELWVSRSTRPGRIEEWSITKGDDLDPEYIMQPYPRELASVRVEFGETNSITVREEGDTAGYNVLLVIETKGFSCEVKKPGNWETATALLPPITRVVCLWGNEFAERKFTKTNWKVGTHFMRSLITTDG